MTTDHVEVRVLDNLAEPPSPDKALVLHVPEVRVSSGELDPPTPDKALVPELLHVPQVRVRAAELDPPTPDVYHPDLMRDALRLLPASEMSRP